MKNLPSRKNERMSPEKGPFCKRKNRLPTSIFQGICEFSRELAPSSIRNQKSPKKLGPATFKILNMTFQSCLLYSPIISYGSFSFPIPGSTLYALGRSRCTANNQSEVVTAQDRIGEKDMLRTKSWARVPGTYSTFSLCSIWILLVGYSAKIHRLAPEKDDFQ